MRREIFLPHDLVHVELRSEWFLFEDGASAAMEELRRTALVVVRRDVMRQGRVPVGIRGMNRSTRFAGWMDPQAAMRIDRPEDLLAGEKTRRTAAMDALWQLVELWREIDRPWGPTGSVGFELASATPATSAKSDLDVVIRFAEPITSQEACHLLASCSSLPATVDVQGETPLGGFSLEEFSRGRGCLLKTALGPRIVNSPWQQEAA